MDGGTTGIDDEFAARNSETIGAWILGRNMFGPFEGVDLRALGFECAQFLGSEKATHVVLRRQG